ncbi:MAG: hypothetical protein ACRECL_08585 [Bradyrhizobium sp.]
MQESTSQARGQGQGKRSPLVIGIAAAFVASAVTIVVMTHSPTTASTSNRAATSSTQCHFVARRMLVSTAHGGGTIRFRASGYLSPPFTLTTKPQVVQFPLPRPTTTPVVEAITVEGNATDIVITSEVTNLHKEFNVAGAYTYMVKWAPLKGC